MAHGVFMLNIYLLQHTKPFLLPSSIFKVIRIAPMLVKGSVVDLFTRYLSYISNKHCQYIEVGLVINFILIVNFLKINN